MPINYPKFDQKINDQITSARMQQAKNRMGTVAQYDRISHTVTVILESNYSDTIGNIVPNVGCPMIYGLQQVAPEPGDRCIIGFRDENERLPYIINFINDFGNERQVNSGIANTGVPRFLI